MHLISYVLTIIILVGIRNSKCDVLVYTQATNQVNFFDYDVFFYQLEFVKVIWLVTITITHSQIIEEFQSLAARFGPSLPPNGLRALAVGADPADGCSPIEEAPKFNFSIHGITPKFVAVIVRGTCSFAGDKNNSKRSITTNFKVNSFCRQSKTCTKRQFWCCHCIQ